MSPPPATAHDVTTGATIIYGVTGEYIIHFFIWSLRPKHGPQPRGRSVSFPTWRTMVTYVTWDIPLHGNFELRPLGVTMGNVIPTLPSWGECKPISRKRRALSQIYQAKGDAPGTVDGCQWHYPLRPKTWAAYPKHLPARWRDDRTQGRAQSLGIRERFL